MSAHINWFTWSNTWFNYLSAFFFTAGGIWAIIRFIHKHWVNNIAQEVKEIHEQTTQFNGGGSMKDALKRIEDNQAELRDYIIKVDNALERHLGYHQGISK